jgi:hypothetical protein
MSAGPDPGAAQPAAASSAGPAAAPQGGDPPGAGTPAPPGTGGDPGSPDPSRNRPAGRSISDAAGQVGGQRLSEKNAMVSRALADLTHNQIGGNLLIGQNFELSFGHGGAQIRVRGITAEELTGPFLSTAEIDQLRAKVGDQPLVVLHGPRGYGKSAALVYMLRGRVRDEGAIFFLDPSTDLTTFSSTEVPEGSVLILQDLPDDAASRLDRYVVERIQSELRARECRLWITTGNAARLTAISADFLVVELTGRPAPREVFERHLKKALVGTGLSLDDVLSWPDVASLLDAHLTPDCSLADAARLATMLFRARDDSGTAAARVRVQMTEYADERVAQWFRKLDSLKAHCMAISLAVLNGLSREVIANAASVLERQILPAPDAPNAPAVTNPFGPDAAVSPTLLDARVAAESIMTDHGPIVVQTMSYRELGYPGRVLRYAWREHDAARPAIVDWLRSLGGSGSFSIRVRVATAVGVLACESMNYLCDEIIAPWAHDDDSETRESAAIALGPAAGDRVLGATIRSLVTDWAGENSHWTLRATAARTYGRSIGLGHPTSALRALARLAEDDDLDLMIATANSYCELVLDGTTPLGVRVLGEVAQLAADRMREKQLVGRLTLLGLSALRGAPPALSDHAAQLRPWPTLLVLAAANQNMTAPAARLWQLSLNDPDFGDSVRESLDDWALAAEDSGDLRRSFCGFMRWVAEDERARTTVVRRARAWTGSTGKAPKTGQSVINDLG